MERLPRWMVCAGCGDRIGLSESAWVEERAGELRRSSLLNMGAEERRSAWRMFHDGCIAPSVSGFGGRP